MARNFVQSVMNTIDVASLDDATAKTLARVAAEGVEAYAIVCPTTFEGTTPGGLVPVEIKAGVFA